MRHTMRVAAGLGILVCGCVLAACASTPSPDDLEAKSGPTTTTSTTTTPTTLPVLTTPTRVAPTTIPGVVVPDVIGMKPGQARLVMRSVGFVLVPFNAPCHRSTLESQSVVSALSVPGSGKDVRVGATALTPGTTRAARSRIGVTWSGCYPNGTTVPDLTGISFDKAVHRLHQAGLAWACFSVPPAQPKQQKHPTTKHPTTTSSTDLDSAPSDDSSTSTTKAPDTSTSSTTAGHASNAPPVLSQGTKPGMVLKAHTVVDFTMRHCPQ